MTKKEISCILSRASREEVAVLAEQVKKDHEIQMVKPPQKTLVMVKARESVKQSLFYLGEVLAAECMVTVDGIRGVSVLAGDDFEKTTDVAVIDGYMNLKKDCGCSEMEEYLKELAEKQSMERGKLNRELLKSKVNFNVMGE